VITDPATVAASPHPTFYSHRVPTLFRRSWAMWARREIRGRLGRARHSGPVTSRRPWEGSGPSSSVLTVVLSRSSSVNQIVPSTGVPYILYSFVGSCVGDSSPVPVTAGGKSMVGNLTLLQKTSSRANSSHCRNAGADAVHLSASLPLHDPPHRQWLHPQARYLVGAGLQSPSKCCSDRPDASCRRRRLCPRRRTDHGPDNVARAVRHAHHLAAVKLRKHHVGPLSPLRLRPYYSVFNPLVLS